MSGWCRRRWLADDDVICNINAGLRLDTILARVPMAPRFPVATLDVELLHRE
jgi:hypothetical protein